MYAIDLAAGSFGLHGNPGAPDEKSGGSGVQVAPQGGNPEARSPLTRLGC